VTLAICALNQIFMIFIPMRCLLIIRNVDIMTDVTQLEPSG